MKSNGLADIDSQFIQGLRLGDYRKVQALRDKLALTSADTHLNGSLHLGRLKSQYAALPANGDG